MEQGDYTSAPYYQFPHLQNPTPNSAILYASAPPFSSDYTSYPSSYPPYPQNPDSDSVPAPSPPTAPVYTPTTPSSNPNLQAFNSTSSPSPFPLFESHLSCQPTSHQQSRYPPYDQHQTPSNYAHSASSMSPNPNPNPNSYPSLYSTPYNSPGSSAHPTYEIPYENSVKFDREGAYFDDNCGSLNRSQSDFGPDLYGKQLDSGIARYDPGCDDVYGDSAYAYEGGKLEPYGARSTSPKSSTLSSFDDYGRSISFDDYGRSISFPSVKESSMASKMVKAVPKADAQEDVKSGVQNFRVKLLPESNGQSTVDVLCQVGLDGIHMLDPSTRRTLKIYPIENITRCERFDSSTVAFWSKNLVDVEPRRIRLQSNTYTTNTLLDTVTAATIQFKEMGGSRRPAELLKTKEQPIEKKKGLADWMNVIKPVNEEKYHWVPDEAVSKCTSCSTDFGAFVRKHHCRNCGDIFCDKCTQGRIALTADENAQPVRVCDQCMAEVTQRLSNAKESTNKHASQKICHKDLARKLQEELEKNRMTTGPTSDGSGRQMKEVECPTCTVHLQVQVPSSGTETIECGVCQHPFLVSAH